MVLWKTFWRRFHKLAKVNVRLKDRSSCTCKSALVSYTHRKFFLPVVKVLSYRRCHQVLRLYHFVVVSLSNLSIIIISWSSTIPDLVIFIVRKLFLKKRSRIVGLRCNAYRKPALLLVPMLLNIRLWIALTPYIFVFFNLRVLMSVLLYIFIRVHFAFVLVLHWFLVVVNLLHIFSFIVVKLRLECLHLLSFYSLSNERTR